MRYVWKPWQQFLLDPDFTESHPSMRNTTDLFLCVKENKLYWLEFEGESHYFNLAVEMMISCRRIDIFSSCDGLVCVCQDDTIHTINPITCEYISYPLCDKGMSLYTILCGVGFDHTIGKFKLLRVTYPQLPLNVKNEHLKVQVCTLDSGTWRNVESIIPEFEGTFCIGMNPFLNGCLHTLAVLKEGDRICAFDFISEQFKTMMLPPVVDDTFCIGMNPFLNGCLHTLAVLKEGDRICAFDFISEQFKTMMLPPVVDDTGYDWLNIGATADFLYLCRFVFPGYHAAFKIEVWMMMEYGIIESWNKIHVINNILNFENIWDYNGIRLLGDGNILLHYEAGFVLFNHETEKVTELDDEIQSKYCPMINIPSFASLNDMVAGVGEVKSWKRKT